jgi:[acyl-carrier-protein] S-malonyltransferase
MKVAWVFPGQGSQSVGMASALLETAPEARALFARVDDALGFSLSSVIANGPEEELTRTEHTQPAIVATSAALVTVLRARFPNLPAPAFVAGHSLGEYSALCAAGALALEDAVRIVHARGRAMQEAVPVGVGAMAAVMGVEADALDALCKDQSHGEVVACANFNAPGQIVIAGHAGAVARVSEAVGSLKGRAIPLKVSAPFHCALMEPAARVVAEKLAGVAFASLACPVVANIDAEASSDPEVAKKKLVAQVTGAVRWQTSVEAMVAAGITHVVEIGPGKVLTGLVKRIAKGVTLTNVSDPASLEAFGAASSS